MSGISTLIICSVIVEFATNRLKLFMPEKARTIATPYMALIIGLIVAFSTGIGLFQTLGISKINIYLDLVFTGLAYSGGSGAVHEIVKLISENRPSNQ